MGVRPWRRVLVVLATLLLACGPSFEAIREGDLRFAHCDRLDLDRGITPSHRLHCWREWRRVYSYGQTRDRVEYARRRIAELVSGDTGAPFELRRTRPRLASEALVETLPGSGPRPASAAERESCTVRCAIQEERCTSSCATRPTGCSPCPVQARQCREACR